jgi:protein-arginine deiminase
VDETLSFLPVDSPRGWVALVADPALARKMLEDAQAQGHGDAKLFSGQLWAKDKQSAPAEVSISEVLANTDVLGASAEAAPHVEAQLAVLRAETGLTDAEIVRVPFLFQWEQGRLAAYQPGTVNLLSLSRTVVAAPDPHGPVIDGKDLFKSQFESALAPYGVTVSWLDDWMLYHRYNGNVHCATNVVREVPSVKWWETGR